MTGRRISFIISPPLNIFFNTPSTLSLIHHRSRLIIIASSGEKIIIIQRYTTLTTIITVNATKGTNNQNAIKTFTIETSDTFLALQLFTVIGKSEIFRTEAYNAYNGHVVAAAFVISSLILAH